MNLKAKNRINVIIVQGNLYNKVVKNPTSLFIQVAFFSLYMPKIIRLITQGDKTLKCKYCDRTFKYHCQLRAHIIKHGGCYNIQ